MLIWARVKPYIYIAAVVAIFYAGYKTHVILDKAELSDQQAKVVEALPEVVTKTQTITKVIHDSSTDKCLHAPVPAALLEQLR